MKLILTRHGETIENKKNIVQGNKLQGTLSTLGIKQAEKLAQRLKNEKIDQIYSSNLKRASDTAKIIAKYHKNTKIEHVSELQEIDHGSQTGTTGFKNHEENIRNLPKDAESFENLQKRLKQMVDKAYKKYPKGTVLFVAHGHVNKSVLTIMQNKKPKELLDCDTPINTAISIFEIKEKNHEIILLNCVKHLK